MNPNNDLIRSILHHLPFISLMAGGPPPQNQFFVRLIEAAIIGGVTTWGTVQVLDTDIAWLKQSVRHLEQKVDTLQIEVYRQGRTHR